jgi:hypothetical protein
LEVSEEAVWSLKESALFANPLFDNFAHYASFSTDCTALSIAKVHRKGELVAVAPLVRLVKYQGTRLLETSSRRWMDPLMGFFTRQTMCLIDATFMAFRHQDPLICLDPGDAVVVRESVFEHLKCCPDVDSVLISEPAGDPSWLHHTGFSTFLHYPQVRVDVEGCSTFDDHLARVGQKRRRNIRQERKLFEQAGVSVEVLGPPIDENLAMKLHACLLASSRRNDGVEVPFEDVLNSEAAFVSQNQWVIVACIGDTIAGFFAFIPHEGVVAQCHGGFDYEHSLAIKAYPNLIHAAVEHAIDSGYREVTLGPLNNEAKRRAGTLAPVMSGIWCRSAISRFVMDALFLKRLHIYNGEIEPGPAGQSDF